MPTITRKFMGRFGNQLFQYAFARAHAERNNCELKTDPWIGEQIFEISHSRIDVELEQVVDRDLGDARINVEIRGYSQLTKCGIYTQAQVRSWFKLKPEVEYAMRRLMPENLSHRRVGDYTGSPYPIISEKSYRDAWERWGVKPMNFVMEENPVQYGGLPPFLPDFYRMTIAPILFRGNSSFSWWAGALSTGVVFSPKTVGLEYQREHDGVEFQPDNWARICDLNEVEPICLASK